MRDTYYQSVGNPLQADRLPATCPTIENLAHPVPKPEAVTQIVKTLSLAGLAALVTLIFARPSGWSWLEPFDLLLSIPILVLGIGTTIQAQKPAWLLDPLILLAAALLVLNHRLPWIGLILMMAFGIGLLTYAFGWHWAILATAAPMNRARTEELRAFWQPQLFVQACAGAVLTFILLWFEAVWVKLAVLTLPVAVLLAPVPKPLEGKRLRIFAESLLSWFTYDAQMRPGLLQSPFGPRFGRKALVVLLAVMAAMVLIRWPDSPLPRMIEWGTSTHDAVIRERQAQGASGFEQVRFGSLPWGLMFAAIILLPVLAPVILAVSLVSPLLWESVLQRDHPDTANENLGGDPKEGKSTSGTLGDLSRSLDPTERNSIHLGRVVADNSPVLIPREVFSEHAHGLGDSGTGKTSLFLCPIIEQLAQTGECSLIILDLKADTLELLATLQAVSESVRNRPEPKPVPLKFFSTQRDKATFAFNPMSQPFWSKLDLLTRTDILCGANGLTYGSDYGQGYYSSANAAILHHALKTFPHVETFRELAEAIGEVIVSARKRDLHPEIRKAGIHVQEVIKRLAACPALNVTPSETGPLAEVAREQIDLTSVFQEPQLIYFHLSATLSPSGAPEIARLVNYMLLAAATQTQERKHPVYLVIDEFQRMVASNLEYMLQLARSMGVGVILANQSMEDSRKSTTNLIPPIEANCRLRQWFSVSSSDDQKRLIESSGTTVDLALGKSVTTGGGGRKSIARSVQEQVVPRITLNDILLTNDHPFRSILHLKRGAGYAQYGGMPVIIESSYHISKEEYDRRKSLPWPEHPGAFIPDRHADEKQPFATDGVTRPLSHAPIWSEEVIQSGGDSQATGSPITTQDAQAIEDLFAQFRATLPTSDAPHPRRRPKKK